MKLVLAIVSNDDSAAVSSALTRNGFQVTKLATTGGFLMAGNTTFLTGVEDEQVDKVLEVIAEKAASGPRSFPAPPRRMWGCTPRSRYRSLWAALLCLS